MGSVTEMKKPAHLHPEMVIRWLMSNMDKVDELAVMFRLKGENPGVSCTEGCSPYSLSLAANILHREALKRLDANREKEKASDPKRTDR